MLKNQGFLTLFNEKKVKKKTRNRAMLQQTLVILRERHVTQD